MLSPSLIWVSCIILSRGINNPPSMFFAWECMSPQINSVNSILWIIYIQEDQNYSHSIYRVMKMSLVSWANLRWSKGRELTHPSKSIRTNNSHQKLDHSVKSLDKGISKQFLAIKTHRGLDRHICVTVKASISFNVHTYGNVYANIFSDKILMITLLEACFINKVIRTLSVHHW